MKFLALALLCVPAAQGFLPTPGAFMPRTMTTMRAVTSELASMGLENAPINLFGKGEEGKGADSKWLLGGKG
jgi:hypothetical protein